MGMAPPMPPVNSVPGPGAGGPPPGPGGVQPPTGAGELIHLDIAIPAEVAQQVIPILSQLVEKVGGTIQPDDGPEEKNQAAGQRQMKVGARANRPSNLQPPAPGAGPAPVGPPQ